MLNFWEYLRQITISIWCVIINFIIIYSGVGANCIYPIVGICKFGWKMCGSDINLESIQWAQ
jgi:23S rRNA A1618 N6-methylase RlmF